MGCELLTEEPRPTREKENTEIFNECFPFYLAIGMSAEEYWTGDSTLVQYYRKAYKIRQEEINNTAWLQGLYIYDAVSTALSNALSKRKSKYASKPYEFHKREKSEFEKAHEVEVEQQKAAAWMEQFVQSHRARAKKS